MSDVSVLWLTADETDALVESPSVMVAELGLQNLSQLAAKDVVNNAEAICALIVNRTRDPLAVDEAITPWGGTFVVSATDLAAKLSQLTPPPDEMGPGTSCVGVWVVNGDNHKPSLSITLSSAPSTGGQPIYLGADMSAGKPNTASVANDGDHGSAMDFYQKVIQGTDVGVHDKQSGHVTMTAWEGDRTAVGITDGDEFEPGVWWTVVAVIDP